MKQPTDAKATTAKLLLFMALLLFGGLAAAQVRVPDTCNRADYAAAGTYYQEARNLIWGTRPNPVLEISRLRFEATQRSVSQSEKDDLYRLVDSAHARATELFDDILDFRQQVDRDAGWTDDRIYRLLSATSGALSDYAWGTLGPIYSREEDPLVAVTDFEKPEQNSQEAEMWLHMADLSCRLDQAGIE